MDAHRLRMATQFGSDLVGRLASPAQKYHLGVKFPISGRVMALGQLAHQAFFLLILRRSRFHLLGHLSVPPVGLFSSLYFITNEERSSREEKMNGIDVRVPFYVMPASFARVMASSRLVTCSLLKIAEMW